MNIIKTGSIVLLKFPFTDGVTYKRRPVLVLKDFADGEILVCRITSSIHNGKYDIYLNEWEKCGLKLPSVVRVHKMVTLEINVIESFMGQIDNDILNKVKSIYNSVI